MPRPPDGLDRGPFWSVFERSRIPMALVDSNRRYVAVNDAATELYRYRREDIIGQRAGSGIPAEDPAVGEAAWEELVRTGENYGERTVRGASGPPMRVSYAAHATDLDGEWVALFVVLSAQLEPHGEQLLAPVAPVGVEAPPAPDSTRLTSAAKALTPREREIVRRVALGRSTPQIAVDLKVSPATVRSHVRNAMVKTGAHTRAQLVALVLGDGLAGD